MYCEVSYYWYSSTIILVTFMNTFNSFAYYLRSDQNTELWNKIGVIINPDILSNKGSIVTCTTSSVKESAVK